ncbi:MAG: hypothetical protein KDC83_06590 [Flavobacteriales bacterium]|nr:hypothetical protein [Flavobacteriales bacterium]
MNQKHFTIFPLLALCTVLFFSACTKKRCSDGKLNQDEEKVDCGGKCDPCPTCSDGIQNQDELKVDCGGPNCLECQPEWFKISSNTTENLKAVDFSGSVGFAVGEAGTILKSENNGDSWTKLSSPVEVNLNEVQVINATNIVIAGDDDNVLFSNDGVTFRTTKTQEKSSWKDLHFFHPDTGVVGGHPTRLCRTQDGGKTWVTQKEWPGARSGIDAISFLNDSVGYAIGDFKLLETLDGGKFWVVFGTSEKQVDYYDFGDLHYMATNRVFHTRKGGLYFSTNSIEWYDKVLNCSGGKFHFKDNLGLYAGATKDGERAKSMLTKDNGVTWKAFDNVANTNIFRDGHVFNATNLLLVGDGGVIFKRR